jgi:hypothetical protein
MASALEEATARRNEVKSFITEAKKMRYQEFMKGFQESKK